MTFSTFFATLFVTVFFSYCVHAIVGGLLIIFHRLAGDNEVKINFKNGD